MFNNFGINVVFVFEQCVGQVECYCGIICKFCVVKIVGGIIFFWFGQKVVNLVEMCFDVCFWLQFRGYFYCIF